MVPWQTPDRDQLTAKYLIRSFPLTQLAWPPWSNGVSCTHAKSQGRLGCVWGWEGSVGLPGCAWSAHPPIHRLSVFTAQHTPAAGTSVCCTRGRHSCSPQRQPQGREGQRPQPLGCFTACCSSLWPVKSICGSAPQRQAP